VRTPSFAAIVIGGGIAGVSVAAELAAAGAGRVAMLEAESQLATHTTGRSAAMFLESYGGPTVRALTTASRAFFTDPPALEAELLTPRGLLWLATPDRVDQLTALQAEVRDLVPSVRLLEPSEAVEICPLLRPEPLALALHEPDAAEIDVLALHAGYVRRLRAHGGEIVASAPVAGLTGPAPREHGTGEDWTVTDRSGRRWRAPVVVNAAGAWCDEVAALAGVRPLGLTPLRRTLFTVAAPEHLDDAAAGAPLVSDVEHTFYVKPEGAGQLLCSPADETPSAPCDARPGELEIARAIDRIRELTVVEARHVRTAWAGLRSFVADREPVAGWEDDVAGFFWLAGQGGTGIQTAPALARTAATLILGAPLPDDVGVTAEDLHRTRLR
jgi:D-arginine dehydrogenase